MRYVNVLVFLIGFTPLAAQAAVTINEIAWMGGNTSANHEWIELHNDASTISLDGWILSDDESLNIPLSGTITTNDYVVLERTSDASAPGSAFLIYTGALKNSGATLTLRRADGGIEDQVSGGEDWQNLGGDNVTKATAQYTTSGWITADPTPGSANVTTLQPVETEKSPSGSAKLAIPVEREPEELKLPGVTLELDLIAPSQGFVNQPILFDVVPAGVGDTIIDSLKYSWNFGDTNTSILKNPQHTFIYPGTYIVHVSAEYARQHAFATKEITILPIAISITKNQDGDIQINNDSPYKIDLSNYRLRAGEVLDIPKNTWLLPRQTITIESSAVKAADKQLTALYDNAGELVASLMPAYLKLTESKEPSPTITPIAWRSVSKPAPESFQFVTEAEAADKAVELVKSDSVNELHNTKEITSSTGDSAFDWTMIALVVLLSVGCIVVLMKPLSKADSLDKYE